MPSHGISSSTQSRSRLSDSQEQPGAAAGPADETAPTTDVKPLKGEDRAACGELTIRYVLVPLDGSPLAECALPWAVAVAQALGARMTLLRVLERPAISSGTSHHIARRGSRGNQRLSASPLPRPGEETVPENGTCTP